MFTIQKEKIINLLILNYLKILYLIDSILNYYNKNNKYQILMMILKKKIKFIVEKWNYQNQCKMLNNQLKIRLNNANNYP